jgi:hypothetical protein
LQAPGGEEKLRLLQGTINDNGTINGGSGFSCSRTGVGQYSVTWTNAFPVSPGLGLAVAPIPGGALTIQITTDFTTGFTVETRNLAGTLQDANWTFVAMGIR